MTARSLKHKFTSSIADAADATLVRPSQWNDDHDFYLGVNAQTGTSYAIANSDQWSLITFNNASAVSASIAQAGAASAFLTGWAAYVRNLGAGTVTITPATSTINGGATLSLLQGEDGTLVSDGANYVFLRGTLLQFAAAAVVTSSGASALTVGRQGATNPALQVDASAASSVTGVKITAAANGSGVGLAAISQGSNEDLKVDGKGTGKVTIGGTSTGNIELQRAITYAGVTFNNTVTGSGNLVGSVSPALTGNPTAPTASAGDNDTSIATTAFVQSALDAQAVQFDSAQSLSATDKSQGIVNIGALVAMNGKCRLTKSGSNLLLSPSDGNTIVINSTVCVIPDAGVTLAAPATNGSNYFIYAYMNSGTMTLEASATGHATQAGTGVEIKSGDATRTLVGQARTVSSAWVDSATQRFVLSWFNRRDIALEGTFSSDTTSSSSVVAIGTSPLISFLSWADEATAIWATGGAKSSAAGGVRVTTYISIDSVAQSSNSFFESGNADFYYPVSAATAGILTETNHVVTLAGKTGSGTATWILFTMNACIRG